MQFEKKMGVQVDSVKVTNKSFAASGLLFNESKPPDNAIKIYFIIHPPTTP